MSDYIKYMYREYLEGRTRIKKVNEDQPLFPNTGAGLLIQKNKLTDDWTILPGKRRRRIAVFCTSVQGRIAHGKPHAAFHRAFQVLL